MSIFFATPCYGGMVTSGFFQSALNLKKSLTEGQVAHEWGILWNESLVTRARNTLLSQFLDTDFEYLFFIDADIQFRPGCVAELWNQSQETNYSILCGSYPLKRKEGGYSSWFNGEQMQNPMTREVDYAGTGFMMIHRGVFEAIIEDNDLAYEENGTKYAVFDTMIEDNTYLSEDYTFCLRAKESGFKILNIDVQLNHWGTYVY